MARKPKRPPRSPAIRARRPIARRPRSTPPLAAGLDLHRCEQFLIHEARLLDEGKFDGWLTLFTPDAWYWVPSEPDQPDPHETVSLIYDDRRLLETRVRRLASPRMYSQEPRSRTSRIVGAALHRLVRSHGRIMIAWKRVDLVNCDAPLDGITIPF